jgi:hypothetical protein
LVLSNYEEIFLAYNRGLQFSGQITYYLNILCSFAGYQEGT